MRAKIAKRRDEEFPNLDFYHWERSWALLKWRGLLEAVERRSKGDKKILISHGVARQEVEDYKNRLIFVFLTKPTPYRTETALLNLTRIVSREDLLALLGEPDKLPQLPEPKRFYFD